MKWLDDKLQAIKDAAEATKTATGKFYDDYSTNGIKAESNVGVYTWVNGEGQIEAAWGGDITSHLDNGRWNGERGTFSGWNTATGAPLNTGGYTGRWQGAVYADTGMYTGEWDGGSIRHNGRLAWLHQKELVLNAHDTENFLDAMNIVRQLDNLTSWMANGLGDLFMPKVSMENGALEQNVHIDASFPNVTDHNEIEEAFGNLVNLASQYANRKSFT